MKTLVLITSNFPFGAGESFIETELPFLYSAFEKIIIVAQNIASEKSREIPEDVTIYRYNPSTGITGFIYMPILILKNLRLIKSSYREDVSYRREIKFMLTLRQRLFLVKKIIKAIQLKDFIMSKISSPGFTSDFVLYSYWLNSGAHAISMIDSSTSVKIARVHGSDLYEEKSHLKYLPLLRFVCPRLDAMFFSSFQGLNYYRVKTNPENCRLYVSKLGVSSPYKREPDHISVNDIFTIVSCSNLIPLKRVNLIIEALSLLPDCHNLRWIHFGDGVLRNELEALAKSRLGNRRNIVYEFRGQVPNRYLLEFYGKYNVDLFINTSSTEGIPVSIMEAQSYSIPVIATDVGAVGEIVTEKTGCLLPVDFNPRELADMIEIFIKKVPEETKAMREEIASAWRENYNAEKNYPEFISMVISIFETLKERDSRKNEN